MDTHSRYDNTERFEPHPHLRATEYDGRGRVARVARPAAPVASVEYGSGWYHAEAIADAQTMHGHPDRW